MYTGRFVEVYEQFSLGRWPEARARFDELVPLIGLLFAEPNPSPVKWMMKQTGLLLSDRVRLPMTPVSEGLERKLAELLSCNR
jgi:4-hydroxy-tetrahydrodipicolinate synthase